MASTNPWTPAPGRHKVNIGSSLGRAIKARKNGAPPQKRSNLPDRDFYSLRYNFKPSSIDSSKPGSIQVKRNKDVTNSSIIVEHPISQANEVHVYKGREEPAKEWACVLIFDEETGGYTLEKIDSFVALEHVERRAASTSEPTPAPTPPANTPIEADEHDPLDDILPDDLVSRPTTAKTKQNDSSEEDIPIQRGIASSSSGQQQSTPPQRAPPKPAPTRSRPQAARPKSPPKPAVPTPTDTKPKAKKGRRQTPELSDEEEILDVQKQPPPKRSRPSPPPPQVPQPSTAPKRSAAPKKQPAPAPPPQRAALELPGLVGAPSAFIPPAPSRNPPLPTQRSVPQPNPEPPIPVPSDSEDDLDMVEVSASPPEEVDPAPGVSRNITMIEETFENEPAYENGNENEGGMEIDVDEFANMMEEHLVEEEDGVQDEGPYEGDVFGSESETELPMPVQRVGSGPMSLNAFAGGGETYDDETSSSDDSDEDED